MKKIVLFILLITVLWFLGQYVFGGSQDPRTIFPVGARDVTLRLNGGEELFFMATTTETVEELLVLAGYSPREEDSVFPEKKSLLTPSMTIFYSPAREVTLQIDGKKEGVISTKPTALDILTERGVVLDEDDIMKPLREETVSEGTVIVLTRVEIKEEIKDTPIAYTTKTEEDETLSWRKTVVKQKGENGTKRTTYRVAYHDGKEVNRRVLSTETVKEPTTHIVVQGTFVKVGKSHKGGASWYAWTGTMAAANPWLPKGSYVRVTNVENGKSVIVVINDRGPFVPGRIIDLDKVAFQKIASLGAGVINVKMEEITN